MDGDTKKMKEKINTSISVATELAAKGKTKELSAWLKEGNNPNQYDDEGWTPLLKASVRGHSETVEMLCSNDVTPASVEMCHAFSKALPIHFAGHSGSLETANVLLKLNPEHIDAVWDLNGHTILLQSVFYGHVPLTKFLLEKGADTSLTTARGLGPMEMAKQFQNKVLVDMIAPYDTSAEKKAANYKIYLQRIKPVIPPEFMEKQKTADELIVTISESISKAFSDPDSVEKTVSDVKYLVEKRGADVNRLGGPLQQPPLIAVVTGNNGFPTNVHVKRLRNVLAKYLLDKGADPTLHEIHPMGAHTIIRACVFNHLDILKMCAEKITQKQLADAINEIPVVNGLTALHDTVLRATMADDEHFKLYLEQTRWCMESGARSDIEDFSGRTQLNIAENASDKGKRELLIKILKQ